MKWPRRVFLFFLTHSPTIITSTPHFYYIETECDEQKHKLWCELCIFWYKTRKLIMYIEESYSASQRPRQEARVCCLLLVKLQIKLEYNMIWETAWKGGRNDFLLRFCSSVCLMRGCGCVSAMGVPVKHPDLQMQMNAEAWLSADEHLCFSGLHACLLSSVFHYSRNVYL